MTKHPDCFKLNGSLVEKNNKAKEENELTVLYDGEPCYLYNIYIFCEYIHVIIYLYKVYVINNIDIGGESILFKCGIR